MSHAQGTSSCQVRHLTTGDVNPVADSSRALLRSATDRTYTVLSHNAQYFWQPERRRRSECEE